MNNAQIFTLIIAILGVLHGPLIPAIIGRVRRSRNGKDQTK